MTHLDGALRYRFENLEGWDQLTCTIYFDIEPAIAHFTDAVRQLLRRHSHAWEVFWPGGHQSPFERLFGLRRARIASCRFRRTTATSHQPDHTQYQYDSSPHGLLFLWF